MSDLPDSHEAAEPPGLSSWMLSFLSARRLEYEDQYSSADSVEEKLLNAALASLERSAAYLVTTGVLPVSLAAALQSFMPGDSNEAKVRELLTYRIVHHRLEFDVAEDVSDRLAGVDKRVAAVTMLTILLLGYNPPPTVIKYFQRATTLFLAGYEPESVIMCGAVLEAALAVRFPNEMLVANRLKPAFKRANDFSVGQRLEFEQTHPILDATDRRYVGEILNMRNDAVHVQLDLGHPPLKALVNLALVLPKILAT